MTFSRCPWGEEASRCLMEEEKGAEKHVEPRSLALPSGSPYGRVAKSCFSSFKLPALMHFIRGH